LRGHNASIFVGKNSFDAEDGVTTLLRNVCNCQSTLPNMPDGEYCSAALRNVKWRNFKWMW